MTTSNGKLLVLLIDGRRAGEVAEGEAGRLTLNYDDGWRDSPRSTPLSLSMPLSKASHGDDVVRPFLWGLLPDNERVLERWARDYQVSARNPFALLRHVGEDCAGTCQFVRPQRAKALLAAEGSVNWIDEDEIADRIRMLRRDPAAWHAAKDGQFSLAGAQAKTALYYDDRDGRWGDPRGAVPTTHIIKPAVEGFDSHDLNEHLCLETARGLGLPAARSKVESFGDERAIVVERYDRVRAEGGDVRRIHQEDMCQALGLSPTAKYQNEGGPTPEQIIQLIRQEVRPADAAERSVERFVDSLAFNWIIGGTDGHAKNYSLLLAGRQVRLAPMYDVASALPYDMYIPRLRLAMRIGSEYRIEGIRGRHWRRFAEVNGLDAGIVLERIDDLAARTPGCLATALQDDDAVTLDNKLPARLAERVADRVRKCRAALHE